MESGYLLYLYALILGIVSYSICLSIGIKFCSLKDYFFSGNSVLRAMSSIVGSLISASILLTGLTAGYAKYGLVILPILLVPGVIGLVIFLRKRATVIVTAGGYGSVEEAAVGGISSPHLGGKPALYCWFSMLYLVLFAIFEISIFKSGLDVLYPGDPWCLASVYLIVLVAAIYVYVGGFKGVLVTDIVQLVLLFTAAILIIPNTPSESIELYVSKHWAEADLPTTILD